MGQRGVCGEDATTIRENPCFLSNNATKRGRRYASTLNNTGTPSPYDVELGGRIPGIILEQATRHNPIQPTHKRASSANQFTPPLSDLPRRSPSLISTRGYRYQQHLPTYLPTHPHKLPQLYTNFIQLKKKEKQTMASEPAPASSAEQNFGASQTSEGEESLSPLEQEVLDEYARLLGNLNNVSPPILSTYPHAPSLRSPLSTPLYPSTPSSQTSKLPH